MEESTCGQSEYIIDTTHPVVELAMPLSGNSYSPNMHCQWRIAVPNFNIVEIKFEKLDIQDDDEKGLCSHDFLEISDEEVIMRRKQNKTKPSKYNP